MNICGSCGADIEQSQPHDMGCPQKHYTDEEDTCLRCHERPVCEEDDYAEHCKECLAIVEQNRAEAAYEASLGECFRGNEAQAYMLEQLQQMRRLK